MPVSSDYVKSLCFFFFFEGVLVDSASRSMPSATSFKFVEHKVKRTSLLVTRRRKRPLKGSRRREFCEFDWKTSFKDDAIIMRIMP